MWNLFERRLGMFVHWGVYSVGGVHEQEWMRRGMSKADYEDYARRFTGERFDPDAWVDAAESFGAEYIVLTAKHHDGFCMWDTAMTDWKATRTPFGRDAVAELSAACRRRGMRLGLYYSNPDWHHPNAFNPLSTHQLPAPNPGDVPDMAKYRAYVKAQIGELLTRYGEIVCLFWDIPPHIVDPEMNALARRLQPGIMINNRGWSDDGDYSTPERDWGDQGSAPARFAEVCDSLSGECQGKPTSYAVTGGIVGGVGAAALVTGIVLMATSKSKNSGDAASQKTAFSISPTRGGMAVTFSGRF